MLRYWVVFLFLFIQPVMSFSQQPGYFILGENQFKGLKVFDIIQDLNQNYYFATNEGIIKYDYISYSKIEVDQAKSISFFNLTINKQGVIFFNNLNNQVFSLKEGKAKLFYELNAEERTNMIHLVNDRQGNLIIGCKGLLVLDNQAKVINRFYINSIILSSYELDSNKWIFPVPLTDSFIVYQQGSISIKPCELTSKTPIIKNQLQFFNFHDTCFALDINDKILYWFNKENWTLTQIKSAEIFNSSTNTRLFIIDNKLWSPATISGLKFSEGNIYSSPQSFYTDYFISDIFKDKEGNILLGTFDKGVLVIPNLKIPDVINQFNKDPIISIYADENETVYLGSNQGVFNRYKDKKIETINSNSEKTIEGIYGSPISDLLIFDDGKVSCYNKNTKERFNFSTTSLKDVAFISANELYLGTSYGIIKAQLKSKKDFMLKDISNTEFRIYSLAYYPEMALLFASSAEGLLAFDKNDVKYRFKYRGKEIYTEKLLVKNGLLYAISNEYGILVIDKDFKIKTIRPQLPNKEETLKQLLVYNNTIIISTSNGLYQIDEKGKIEYQYHSSYGFASKKIHSFSIANHKLWVSHSGGVQMVDLKTAFVHIQTPLIVFKSLSVNNLPFEFNNEIEFNSNQRKFDFEVCSPTLRNMENIKYHYKLIGYDDTWQTQGFRTNTISYNALSPGNYMLIIKAENLGKFSQELNYSFSIASPLYLKPWFIVLVVVCFLLLVFYIYWRQLANQKEKLKQINELNLSKLTAIQSQMNPHFIFNSLNSIQDLVLQQNAPKAYDSIGKFALLIRSIMHHSGKEYIDIEEELSILNVYLELELLRFKKDFTFNLNAHDLADIEIPPMLIQPYIENAIKHGLLHKSGEKKLNIDMRIEEEVFVCEVVDNGVGRVKSQEMKQRQNKFYESFSGKTLDKRLSILKKYLGGDFGVDIFDLYENGIASGTKVIIRAPFKQKY